METVGDSRLSFVVGRRAVDHLDDRGSAAARRQELSQVAIRQSGRRHRDSTSARTLQIGAPLRLAR
jgi:hypothetical protein